MTKTSPALHVYLPKNSGQVLLYHPDEEGLIYFSVEPSGVWFYDQGTVSKPKLVKLSQMARTLADWYPDNFSGPICGYFSPNRDSFHVGISGPNEPYFNELRIDRYGNLDRTRPQTRTQRITYREFYQTLNAWFKKG